jgi:hypothetical protein
MAILITKGTTSLATANGFYRVEASNLGCFSTTALALTTTRTIAVTFANAGNCQGLLLNLWTTSMTLNRGVRVELQENTGSWVTRAAREMYPLEICGDNRHPAPARNLFRGQFFTFFDFATPYAVDTTASKWRFEISHIGTGGTWNIRTSNGTAPFYATWCDNQLSWTDGDILVVKDKCTIDRSAVFGAVLADRYVYFTDYSVILPAGVQLNLGDVSNWYLGKPVEPYIATNLSPADVWAVLASTQTGAGTMGKMAVDVDKKTGLIPALL